jgi:hypothetical protein
MLLILLYDWLCYAVFSESNDIDSTCVELLQLLANMQNIVRRKHIFSHFMFLHSRLFEHGKHILTENRSFSIFNDMTFLSVYTNLVGAKCLIAFSTSIVLTIKILSFLFLHLSIDLFSKFVIEKNIHSVIPALILRIS